MQESTKESTKPLMLKLKESTKPLHDSTEQHEFQKLLGTGSIDKESYIVYLEQLYSIHSCLSEHLKAAMKNERVKAVVMDRNLDLNALESDLNCFNKSKSEVKSLKATDSFLKLLEEKGRTNPEFLLGTLYVLEGSTHGAKYMASTLRKGLSLEDRLGSSYFDRYQENQMSFWLEFKKSMNEQNFAEETQAQIIELAKSTFKAFSDIGTEIIAQKS